MLLGIHIVKPHPDTDGEQIEGCMMWHHQGGDYDRDCPACMALAAEDQGLQRRGRIAAMGGASMYEAADPLGNWPRRGPGTAEVIELAAITLGRGEVVCGSCYLVHRPGIECP